MGGESIEREVSLMSAVEMQNALDHTLYDVIPVEIHPNDPQWVRQLIDLSPDLVLSALHGGTGENGAVQGLLECLHIPYVGSRMLGSALCMDKIMSKSIMRAHHIPVAEDVSIPYGAVFSDYEEKIRRLGLPLVVKINQGGSSVGVYIVRSWEALTQAVEDASAFKDAILIERFIEGQEVTCGIMETDSGLMALPVLDIAAADTFYDYHAKYFSDETRIAHTAFPPFIRDMIEEIAKQAFMILACSGYARVDMIICEEQIYVLEVNTLPGLTSHSLFPKAAALAGMTYGQMLDRLIAYAAGRSIN